MLRHNNYALLDMERELRFSHGGEREMRLERANKAVRNRIADLDSQIALLAADRERLVAFKDKLNADFGQA